MEKFFYLRVVAVNSGSKIKQNVFFEDKKGILRRRILDEARLLSVGGVSRDIGQVEGFDTLSVVLSKTSRTANIGGVVGNVFDLQISTCTCVTTYASFIVPDNSPSGHERGCLIISPYS